jgi:diguanylate cyclase (GGDEF)-like protein
MADNYAMATFHPRLSPKALPSGGVFLASLLVVALIAYIDMIDGPEIWLTPLYTLPVGAVAFFCAQKKQFLSVVVLSVVCQTAVFHSYHLANIPEIADSCIALASSVLIAYFGRLARNSYLAMDALATTDFLTGLKNRRSFDSITDLEIAKQKRYGGHFSLAIIDLDGFKRLNDSLGHRAGDKALQALAGILSQSMRQSDTVARIGGDEFAVLMPNTMAADCQMICRQLSERIATQMADAGFRITASIGFSTFEEPPESTSEALHKVDLAMYSAKRLDNGSVIDADWMSADSHLPARLHASDSLPDGQPKLG